MANPSSPKLPIREESRFRRPLKPDEVTSNLTCDSLIVLRKRYFFPNDLVARLPSKSEKVCSPPTGFISCYEMSLQAGIRFPLAPELLAILFACGVCLSQLSCRAVTIVMGLISFFRERGASLTPEILSRICRFLSDPHGRVSCRSKMLELRVKDPPKNWSGGFFFVKNEWNLPEKWCELKDLPSPLHVGEEDLLQILDFPTLDDFRYAARYLSKFISEEFLFKMGLSIQAGRSHAVPLKTSTRAEPSLIKKATSKKTRLIRQDDEHPSKKKKASITPTSDKSLLAASSVPESSSKFQVPEDLLKHSCLGMQQAANLIARRADLDLELDDSLKAWNTEFITIKYLQAEYRRRYKGKVKEVADLESQLSDCRSELANMVSSLSSHIQEVDRARGETLEAQTEASRSKKSLETLEAKVEALERENTRLSAMMVERNVEADSQVIENFKNSIDFKMIIQDHVQEERDHIFSVEVKDLEKQNLEEGFLRGFLKATRLVQRKTGADIDGLSPSQVSDDPPSDSEDEVESVL